MKGQTETIKLAVEIVTPVHVGSGEELHRELDYIEHREQIFVVDQNRTFNAIASGSAALDTLQQANPELSDSVRLAGAYYGYPLPNLRQSPTIPEKFRACIKDAMQRPYLPGSSVKGAIRTALLATWLRSKPDEAAEHLPRWKNISKYVFGDDPNKDLLRAFHVGDANFPVGDLRLADIRWLNIIGNNNKTNAKWRNMSNRGNENRWEDATGIYVEALAPTATAAMILQWDRFLLSDPSRWQAPHNSRELLPKNFAGLSARLNTHARYILEEEIAFFGRYNQQLIVEQCRTLLQDIRHTDNAAFLRVAWGSGWRGITGDWLDTERLKKIRGLYELGKKECETFPKTRRLAVKEKPCLPLGWIRLSPWSDRTEKSTGSPKPSLVSPWVEQQIAAIQKQHNAPADDALRGQLLARAWQALEDDNLKRTALEDIRRRWQDRGWWDNPPSRSVEKTLQIYKEVN